MCIVDKLNVVQDVQVICMSFQFRTLSAVRADLVFN